MSIDPARPIGTPSVSPSTVKVTFKTSTAELQPAQVEPKDEFESPAKVTVFPQDPLVGPTESMDLPKALLGDRLSSPRITTRDNSPVAIADPEGNYHYEVGTPQFDQVNAHSIVANTLLMYDRYLGKPAKWSFPGPLNVLPHKGNGKTAYFSRGDRSINFFEWQSPSLGKRVTTAQSADVIAHEIGHAIWDGLRPLAGYSNEAGAFHEAFGDCSALLHALQPESNLAKALEQNGGDLTKPSLLSRMAEEFGSGFNREDKDPKNDERPYYRTAINDFKYIDPKKLPDDDYPPTVGEDVLTREFHSFSRVWTGTFYRMLTSLYDGGKADGLESLAALKNSRDKLGQIWGKALHELPPTGIKFGVVAESMLKVASRNEDAATFDRLAAVLVDRNVLDQAAVDRLRKPKGVELQMPLDDPSQVLNGLESALELQPGYRLEGEPQQLEDGRTVFMYTRPESAVLPGLTHEGDHVEVELRSGLSATFDSSGKLLSHYLTEVGETEREEAALFTQDLLRKDRVKENTFSLQSENESGRVFLGRLIPDRQGVKVFERLPIFD